MRFYEIYTKSGSVFQIECDEIIFRNDFTQETTKDALCLFKDNQVVAVFKEWESFLDITEKCLNVS